MYYMYLNFIWLSYILFLSFKNSFSLVVWGMTLVLSFIWLYINTLDMNKLNKMLINLLGYIILGFLWAMNMWKLMILYEVAMIPMMFIILGWGTNPSRFSATFYMLLYTAIFSFPALMIVLWNFKLLSYMEWFSLNTLIFNNIISSLMYLLFMVKTPIYCLHYWLPKAHVEASTTGSMVLASGLLKLGSMGVLKILLWTKFSINNIYFMLSTMISALICLIQTDFKKLIALMSVSHMSISLTSLHSFLQLGWTSFLLMNMVHTIMSSLMFYMAGVMYFLSKTRLMILNFSSGFKFLNIIFILMISSNLGLPPFFSSFMELVVMSSIFCTNYLTVSFLIITIMGSLVYNLLLFSVFKSNLTQFIKTSCYLGLLGMICIILMLWMMSLC